METGLLIRYGKLVPGREAQAIALFNEAVQFFQGKLAKQELTFFEPFFMFTGDLEEEIGFFIMKGPAPEIFRMMEEEPYRTLMMKGSVLVEHMRADVLTVGEGIAQQLERSLKVNTELGI